MQKLDLHLISDASGEALISVSRASVARFDNLEVKEFVWSLVKSNTQLDAILEKAVNSKPSFIMFTITDDEIREYLKSRCRKLQIPCLSILSKVIREISAYLGIIPCSKSINEYALSDDYFARIDAMNYVLSHDDGQNMWDLDEADIVLVGASRTSKSPTSVYLSYRGYKVANIPFVKGIPLPENLFHIRGKLIIGLTINADRLVEIRRNRLISMNDNYNSTYAEKLEVMKELIEAKRIFSSYNWPIIDVTNKSVEEIAATIVNFYKKLIL